MQLHPLVLILASGLCAAAGPEMRPGEWEFSPPGTHTCFTDNSPLIGTPAGLEGCSTLQIQQTKWSFTYSTTCNLLGVTARVTGAATLDGPDSYTNTTHVHIDDGSGEGSETTAVITIRRIGPCQPGDSTQTP